MAGKQKSEKKTAGDQPKPKRRWLRRTLLTIIWLMVVAGGTVVYLWWAKPADYKEFQAFLASRSEVEIEEIAVAVEDKFSAVFATSSLAEGEGLAADLTSSEQAAAVAKAIEAGEIDASVLFGPRQMTVTRDEANVWLSQKLPEWIESRGYPFPSQVSDLMAATEGRYLVFRFNLETEEISQVVSMTMDAKFQDDGKVLLTLQSIKGGQLPLPLSSLTGVLKKNAGGGRMKEAVEQMTNLFDGQTFDTRFKFDELRDLIVVGLDFVENRITLKMRLLPSKKVQATADAGQ